MSNFKHSNKTGAEYKLRVLLFEICADMAKVFAYLAEYAAAAAVVPPGY